MINRTALTLHYKDPAIRWINEADPVEDALVFTSEQVNMERTVYLISNDDGENEVSQKNWISQNYIQLFESELEGWYTDEGLWPSPLTLELFYEWFDTEFNTVIIDTVDEPIVDDGF